jgi:hypothetical protein
MHCSGMLQPSPAERYARCNMEKDGPVSGPNPGLYPVSIGFKKDAYDARHA